MIFNDHDFRDLLVVEKIERSFLPPLQNYSKQVPGKTGLYFTRNEIGIGLIKVSVRLIEKSRSEVQERVREIAGKLYTKKPSKLILRDDFRYNIAIVSGTTDVSKFIHTGHGVIDFECHDPYAYGVEKTIKTNLEFANNGTAPATGTINITASKTDSILVSASNQLNELKIIYPFKGGESLLIDLKNQTISINNTISMEYLSFDSDFFEIPPGPEQQINVNGGSGVLMYRERWL